MKKLYTTLLLTSLLTYNAAAKEVFIMVDSSAKFEKKATLLSLLNVLQVSKQKQDDLFLQYDDHISAFIMTEEAEKLQKQSFDNQVLEQTKESRGEIKKKTKDLLIAVVKVANNKTPTTLHVPTTDVVFCMDSSGSMMKDGNYKKATEIANQLIDSIKTTKTQVALVSFSNKGQINSNFSSDRELLKKKFSTIIINGETNAADGLEKSYALLQNSRADIKKVILLSDGTPDNEQLALTAAKKLHGSKVDIITIALKGANIDFLDKVSTSHRTLDASQVNLNTISESIRGIPSPILESLNYMSNEWTPGIEERSLIIFSTMMQRSSKYNFYAESNLRDPATINRLIKMLRNAKMLPNLKNTKVYVQGMSTAIGAQKNSELEAFWKEYFKACGAVVASWSPTSINLKK